MVFGRWIVSCGVFCSGVLGPKAPMELGKNTAQSCRRATSSALA